MAHDIPISSFDVSLLNAMRELIYDSEKGKLSFHSLQTTLDFIISAIEFKDRSWKEACLEELEGLNRKIEGVQAKDFDGLKALVRKKLYCLNESDSSSGKQNKRIPFKADFLDKTQKKQVKYRMEEFSIDMSPFSYEISTTLAINFLTLGVLNDVVIQLSGYFPYVEWIRTSYNPPDAPDGALILAVELDFPGATHIYEKEVQVYHNPATRWTCIGDPQAQGIAVEFITDCIAIIDAQDALGALWIRLDISPVQEAETRLKIASFNNLPWHDATLKKIVIPRETNDIIKTLVEWPEYEGIPISWIEFFDCYAFKADMHFGISPPDSILQAECTPQSKELDELKSVWREMGVDLSDLMHFEIRTNSTNSLLKILCRGFKIRG